MEIIILFAVSIIGVLLIFFMIFFVIRNSMVCDFLIKILEAKGEYFIQNKRHIEVKVPDDNKLLFSLKPLKPEVWLNKPDYELLKPYLK